MDEKDREMRKVRLENGEEEILYTSVLDTAKYKEKKTTAVLSHELQ